MVSCWNRWNFTLSFGFNIIILRPFDCIYFVPKGMIISLHKSYFTVLLKPIEHLEEEKKENQHFYESCRQLNDCCVRHIKNRIKFYSNVSKLQTNLKWIMYYYALCLNQLQLLIWFYFMIWNFIWILNEAR